MAATWHDDPIMDRLAAEEERLTRELVTVIACAYLGFVLPLLTLYFIVR